MVRKVDERLVQEFRDRLLSTKLKRHYQISPEKRISQQPSVRDADKEVVRKIRDGYIFDGTELHDLKKELILQYGGDPDTYAPAYSGATTESFTANIPDIGETFRIKMVGKKPNPPYTTEDGLEEILKNNNFKEELLWHEMPGYTLTIDWSDYYQVQPNAHPFDEALRGDNWKAAADAWKSFWGAFHFGNQDTSGEYNPKTNDYTNVYVIEQQAKFNTYIITEAVHNLINQLSNQDRRDKWSAAVNSVRAGLINQLKKDTPTTSCFTDGKASNYFFLDKEKDTWSCTTMCAEDMGWKTYVRNIREKMNFTNNCFYTGLPQFDLGVFLESIERDSGLSHVVSYLNKPIETFITEGVWIVNEDITYNLSGLWDPFIARKALNLGRSYVKIGRARKAADTVTETSRFLTTM